MKCPVMSQPYESGEYQSKWHGIDCLKEECAWWLKAEGICSITALGMEAVYKLWDRDRPKGYEGG